MWTGLGTALVLSPNPGPWFSLRTHPLWLRISVTGPPSPHLPMTLGEPGKTFIPFLQIKGALQGHTLKLQSPACLRPLQLTSWLQTGA